MQERHEQRCLHEAEEVAPAKSTGKLSVAIKSQVDQSYKYRTGIANAMSDSIPLWTSQDKWQELVSVKTPSSEDIVGITMFNYQKLQLSGSWGSLNIPRVITRGGAATGLQVNRRWFTKVNCAWGCFIYSPEVILPGLSTNRWAKWDANQENLEASYLKLKNQYYSLVVVLVRRGCLPRVDWICRTYQIPVVTSLCRTRVQLQLATHCFWGWVECMLQLSRFYDFYWLSFWWPLTGNLRLL